MAAQATKAQQSGEKLTKAQEQIVTMRLSAVERERDLLKKMVDGLLARQAPEPRIRLPEPAAHSAANGLAKMEKQGKLNV